MQTLLRRLALFLCLCAGLALAPPAARADDAATRQLAHRIVVETLAPKAGDVVLITGSTQNVELMEDLSIELRKVGAWAIPDLVSDRVTKAYYDEVSPSYDSQVPESNLKLATIIAAQINLDYASDPKLFAGISPARVSATAAAAVPVTKYVLKHGIPYVEVGNGMYPSQYTAAQWGITLDQLARMYADGLAVGYATIRANAAPVEAALSNGHLVYVNAPNGTDVTFEANSKLTTISDGRITPAMRRKGGLVYTALPAGEIFFVPAPGSAHGVVVFDPFFFNNTEVDGLTMTFAHGRVISMTAKSGLSALKAYYDASTAGKDAFSFADFGLNPGVKYVPGTKMNVFMAAGMVSLGIGGDVGLGGSNASTFQFASTISGATVTVDGKPIVSRGALVK